MWLFMHTLKTFLLKEFKVFFKNEKKFQYFHGSFFYSGPGKYVCFFDKILKTLKKLSK